MSTVAVATETCTRCHRTRRVKFLIQRKNQKGKLVWRCRARSVCSTKGRRIRRAQ